MTITIELQEPQDRQALDIYHEIIANESDLAKQGIQINFSERHALSPDFIEGLIVGITGGVATHYIVHLIDFVLSKIKSKKYYNMSFIIKHEGTYFNIPEQRTICILYFDELNKDNDND